MRERAVSDSVDDDRSGGAHRVQRPRGPVSTGGFLPQKASAVVVRAVLVVCRGLSHRSSGLRIVAAMCRESRAFEKVYQLRAIGSIVSRSKLYDSS